MKKILIAFVLLSMCVVSQTYQRVPVTTIIRMYSQAREDSLAITLLGIPNNENIWNTTLSRVRVWNGVNFYNQPLTDPTIDSTSTMLSTYYAGVSNGANQFLKLTPAGKYPSYDGSLISNVATGVASITANTAPINTTETVIVKTSALSVDRLKVGTTIRITWFGTCTSTVSNRNTFSIRIGTTGTISDPLMQSNNSLFSAVAGTAIPFKVIFEITIRSIGVDATSSGSMLVINNGITGIMASAQGNQILIPTYSTFNSTTPNIIISSTYKTAAVTTTSIFQNAQIEFIYK